MSQQESRITQDILDEPHIEGRRIPVLTIVKRVEERGLEPREVAERFDLDIAETYAALLYYHDHPGKFETLEDERERIITEIEAEIDRPEDIDPPNA